MSCPAGRRWLPRATSSSRVPDHVRRGFIGKTAGNPRAGVDSRGFAVSGSWNQEVLINVRSERAENTARVAPCVHSAREALMKMVDRLADCSNRLLDLGSAI